MGLNDLHTFHQWKSEHWLSVKGVNEAVKIIDMVPNKHLLLCILLNNISSFCLVLQKKVTLVWMYLNNCLCLSVVFLEHTTDRNRLPIFNCYRSKIASTIKCLSSARFLAGFIRFFCPKGRCGGRDTLSCCVRVKMRKSKRRPQYYQIL